MTILFTSDMDLFLSVLAAATFPSDALVVTVWEVDLTLDVRLLGGLLLLGVVGASLVAIR